MILETMENASLYYGVAPRMQRAFELLATIDLNALQGRNELEAAISSNISR